MSVEILWGYKISLVVICCMYFDCQTLGMSLKWMKTNLCCLLAFLQQISYGP